MAREYLTTEEIYAKYPDQWVLLDKPKADRCQNLLGGYVVASTKDREELEGHMDRLSDSPSVAVFHTSTRPFRAVPSYSPVGTLPKSFFLLCLVVGVGWAAREVTLRTHVPFGVRTFPTCADALEVHANSVRDGRLEPEPDPNGIVRYPLLEELRRAGISVCIVRDGVIWYHLPSHPLDGGSPYLVSPLDRAESVGSLPGRGRGRTYEFTTLRGNWAYWFGLN
jgi:hypothetical protein